jgi:hypothetical protein
MAYTLKYQKPNYTVSQDADLKKKISNNYVYGVTIWLPTHYYITYQSTRRHDTSERQKYHIPDCTMSQNMVSQHCVTTSNMAVCGQGGRSSNLRKTYHSLPNATASSNKAYTLKYKIPNNTVSQDGGLKKKMSNTRLLDVTQHGDPAPRHDKQHFGLRVRLTQLQSPKKPTIQT